MKKILLSLAAAFTVAGALAAQSPDPDTLSPIIDGEFPFDAGQIESVESRYSAGLFSSYADDFLGVNDYDGEVNTFAVLGGGAAQGAGFFGAGLATQLKSLYLGVYYGGNFVEGKGYDNGKDGDDAATHSESKWKNNVILLLGNLSFGALRFDIAMDTEDEYDTAGGEKSEAQTMGDFVTSVTWGNNFGKLSPHVSVGFKWPATYFKKVSDDITNETSSGAELGLKVGTLYTPDDTSIVSGDLVLQGNFGTSGKTNDNDYSEKGDFAVFLSGGYSKTVPAGDRLTLKFKPAVALGLKIDDTAGESGGQEYKNPTYTTFEFDFGLSAGIEVKLHRLFKLYSGARLNVFNALVQGASGGDPEAGGGAWKLRGISWNIPETTNAGGANTNNLGLGLVFAPNDNLSVGCGLNTILDKLFYFDLTTMRFYAGDFWKSGNFGIQNLTGGILDGTTLDLTLSYKL
ncbi:MAG: hypothetical protein LBD86_04730 [Spirochaetaceae bacterium]|jgi:hypothetical protein|nr:hypothetical protein [Spirochaetaceae bacterium]